MNGMRPQPGAGPKSNRRSASPAWRKSAHSEGGSGQCVEVAEVAGAVAVRDSLNPDGPVLAFSPAAWQVFLTNVKSASYR